MREKLVIALVIVLVWAILATGCLAGHSQFNDLIFNGTK